MATAPNCFLFFSGKVNKQMVPYYHWEVLKLNAAASSLCAVNIIVGAVHT